MSQKEESKTAAEEKPPTPTLTQQHESTAVSDAHDAADAGVPEINEKPFRLSVFICLPCILSLLFAPIVHVYCVCLLMWCQPIPSLSHRSPRALASLGMVEVEGFNIGCEGVMGCVLLMN